MFSVGQRVRVTAQQRATYGEVGRVTAVHRVAQCMCYDVRFYSGHEWTMLATELEAAPIDDELQRRLAGLAANGFSE